MVTASVDWVAGSRASGSFAENSCSTAGGLVGRRRPWFASFLLGTLPGGRRLETR